MNRFFQYIRALGLVTAVWAGHAEAATMQAVSTNGASGTSVTVPLTIKNSSGALGGYAVTVSFDPSVVRFVGVLGGSGQFAAAPTLVVTNVPGKVRFVHQQTGSTTAPTGTVVVSRLNFTAVGPTGSSSTVKLSNANADNTDGQALPVTGLTDGVVQVAILQAAPVAAFSADQTAGAAPLVVNFTDSSTGTITNRTWNFGDGSTTNITGTSITHTFTDAGTYTVGLTVAGPAGFDSVSKTKYITVTNVVSVTYAINTTAAPSVGGTTSGGGTKIAGASVTVSATANPGYNFVDWTEGTASVSTAASYLFTASGNRNLVANFSVDPINTPAVQITVAPTVTNALMQVGNTVVVAADEPSVFAVAAVSSTAKPLFYSWLFGDGTGSGRSSNSFAAHSYPPECGDYSARVAVDDGTVTSAADLTVSVACSFEVTGLQAKPNFRKANADQCSLKGTLDLPANTVLSGKLLTVNVGAAQVSFDLHGKGRGVNGRSSCRLKYNKRTGLWGIAVSLRNGSWRDGWAASGLSDTTILKPGVPAQLTAVILLEKQSFAAEKAVLYTAKQGVAGVAK